MPGTTVVAAMVVISVVDVAATVVMVVAAVVMISHERLMSMVHLCFKQHSHMDEERYESCSSGDMLAKAAISDLTPFKQIVSAPIISG